MRAVIEAIDRLGIRYFITGSVAASVHGVLRQSQDIDIVVDLMTADFGHLSDALGDTFAIAEPIEYDTFAMASVVHRYTAEKTDLILRSEGPFEASALQRRALAEVPGLGSVWVASVEDLIIAKLVWSEGVSELQLRDCAQLLRIHHASLDRPYLERWATRLGVSDRLAGLA